MTLSHMKRKHRKVWFSSVVEILDQRIIFKEDLLKRINAVASLLIDAQPSAVYALVTDYRVGHVLILPKEYLYDLRVEAGGQGDGTIISFRSRVLGVERENRARISELEPGRKYVENEANGAFATTYTFTPMNEGRQVRVEIATNMKADAGLMGLLEHALLPSILRRINEKELQLIANVMRDKQATTTAH
jgi:hypothetical protein